ncbi:hypothetical protein PTT_08835 [Pyrenophora teres f. teres 0-1]|uniref:Uncharacterized protein n=1 Tax=Pyrenophora teres f. teres (strain 0-1) TaxID=861557 RepID=E3RKQ0_PYRTT|nr:hypothetical protein PTT_08836 [Pyrenophora teres f. teres 0-1]EFQ93699.1 hypothetical protein PTT_08835 [Pyrenophora teres f. teres 0-1]
MSADKATGRDQDVSDKARKSPHAGIVNYIRVFTYGTKLDICLVMLCCFTSIGSGVAFPLMNIVFGMSQLVRHVIMVSKGR